MKLERWITEIPSDDECRAMLGPVFYWAFAGVGVVLGLALGIALVFGPDIALLAAYLIALQ